MVDLYHQLGYPTGEFTALRLINHAVFGPVNQLPSCRMPFYLENLVLNNS